jgi:hypothetical protein
MHRSGADACWSRALVQEFIAMQQSMAGIQLVPKRCKDASEKNAKTRSAS